MRFAPSRILWILLLAPLLGCGAGSGSESAGGDPAAPVSRSPRPLIVVGIDGATWDVIDPMMARGELPTFRRLAGRGTRADLITLLPLSSPVVWTTLATGRFGRHHNLLDHTYPYVPGPKRRIDSTLRRVPAIWNVASHHSRTVGVVGYFATHPPEAVNGVMVSDRVAKGAAGGVYPPELAAELQGEVDRLADGAVQQEIYRRYLPWSFDEYAIHRPEDPYHEVTKIVRGRIHRQALYDEFIERTALRLAPRGFDLFMVYLRMPDHAAHSTWLFFDDSEFEQRAPAFEKEMLQGVIPATYRQADRFLSELLAVVGDEANLVVLSDHGSGPTAGPWAPPSKLHEIYLFSGSHRPDGILLAAGPDIRHGELEGVTIMDVAPTLSALLDLPLSEELPGTVLEGLLRPDFVSDFPLRQTPGYRMRWQTVESPEAPSDEAENAELEMLASLGYIGGETELAGRDAGGEADFWSFEPKIYREAIFGEILFHAFRDDLEEVERLSRLLEENDPEIVTLVSRKVKKNLNRWQASFDYPLLSPEAEAYFDGRTR